MLMTAQEYIQSKLEDLRRPLGLEKPANDEQLAEAIFKHIMSKKFRKYSASDELQAHIREAIRLNIEKREPINVTFFHGAYKLWRLEEAPETDWAELFALTYFSNWVKPVCELYEPGVWFDFFVDDLIVPRINNVDPGIVDAYIASYQKIMDFLKQYQPQNMRMTITPVGSRFDSRQAYDEALERSMQNLTNTLPGGLPKLSDAQKATADLNVKVTKEQLKDPLWREKVELIHSAYMARKGGTGYTKGRPDKILAFTQPLPTGATISVGTTKDSIMKFWVGVGVLKPKDDSYRQIILSSTQLADAAFTTQPVAFAGLEGKNFREIRILAEA
jgi:hypothetical protein